MRGKPTKCTHRPGAASRDPRPVPRWACWPRPSTQQGTLPGSAGARLGPRPCQRGRRARRGDRGQGQRGQDLPRAPKVEKVTRSSLHQRPGQDVGEALQAPGWTAGPAACGDPEGGRRRRGRGEALLGQGQAPGGGSSPRPQGRAGAGHLGARWAAGSGSLGPGLGPARLPQARGPNGLCSRPAGFELSKTQKSGPQDGLPPAPRPRCWEGPGFPRWALPASAEGLGGASGQQPRGPPLTARPPG